LLSSPTGGATLGSQSTAVLTIVDNDPAGAGFAIGGRVANHSGTGIPNVQITRTGSSNVVTNANGDFTFANVLAGSYTIAPLITPSLQGVTMYPASKNVTVTSSNITNQLFQASFTVSGRVANHAGTGIPNVQVKRVAGPSTVSVFTDAGGNYRFTDVRSGSYVLSPVLTPAMTGMSFTPASTNLTVGTANVTNQNFIGMFSVGGRIATSANVGISGVLVRLDNGSTSTTVLTDASGNYKFVNVRSGTYSILPTKSGQTFSPAIRSGVVVSTLNIGNQSFTGSG
jgi:hypothetical protein